MDLSNAFRMSTTGENLVPEECSPKALLRNYLLEQEPVFARLYKLQQEVSKTQSLTLQLHEDDFAVNQGMET